MARSAGQRWSDPYLRRNSALVDRHDQQQGSAVQAVPRLAVPFGAKAGGSSLAPKPSVMGLPAKPTGGLEPPTPSLRVMAGRAVPAYASRLASAFGLHTGGIGSDVGRRP
jgi:hypothetical protein